MLVIVILVLQAASHVAQRLLGARSGLAVSGFLGGFVSSTATIGAMGSLARQRQVPVRMTLCASILSTAATWMQIVLMILVVSPAALPVTSEGGMTRKLPKASSSVEMQRPAVSKFFMPLGVSIR
jgi:uncharacterized membrane protein (DUF4010 family)